VELSVSDEMPGWEDVRVSAADEEEVPGIELRIRLEEV
jgi:hypothetical protein